MNWLAPKSRSRVAQALMQTWGLDKCGREGWWWGRELKYFLRLKNWVGEWDILGPEKNKTAWNLGIREVSKYWDLPKNVLSLAMVKMRKRMLMRINVYWVLTIEKTQFYIASYIFSNLVLQTSYAFYIWWN